MVAKLATVPISFSAYLHEAGYHWVEASEFEPLSDYVVPAGLSEPEWSAWAATRPLLLGRDEVLLVPKVVDGARVRVTDAVLGADFFLMAASVQPTPENILRFAEQCGPLGLDQELVRADRLTTWQTFIRELNEALELQFQISEAYRKGEGQITRVYSGPPGQIVSEVREVVERVDLAYLIRQHLRGGFSGDFQIPRRRPLDANQRPRPTLSFQPTSLGTFAWAQFASELTAGKRIHKCLECGRWLVTLPAGDRMVRTTCSGRCRSRLWIRRKAEAVRLHQQGKAVAEIARELDAEPGSVKAWLNEGAVKGKATSARKPAGRRRR